MPPRWLKDLFYAPPPADPEDDQLDMELVEWGMEAIGKLSFWHRPEFHGVERVPRQGPALMVGNHGLMGVDAPLIWRGVYEATGRVVRGLGDDILFSTPLVRELLHRIGALHGTPENGLRFLRAGHLVNVYPGGARDGLKPPERRYRLSWERARGFVRLAMRAEAPIILHMCIGNDDTYLNLGRIKWPARVVGNPKYEVPWLVGLGPLSLPVKLEYYFSEPLHLEGGPEGAEDPDLVDRHHAMIWELGEQMLREGVRRRGARFFG